jgi:hypothetical protein
MKKCGSVAILVIITALCGVVALRLELRRQARHDEIAMLRRQKNAVQRQTEENSRAVEAEGRQVGDVVVQQSEEIEEARRQVAALERRATSRRAEMQAESARRKTADAAALAVDNRDPEKGMARLEFFKNVGRANPNQALQTLIWAALSGEQEELKRGLLVEGRARARAEVLIGRLPREAKASATPEGLAALWFSNRVLDVPAAQMADVVFDDAAHATVVVRGGIGDQQSVQMQLGPTGWQVVVPERALEGMQKEVLGASPPLPGH